jgi:hypothetical protein
MYNSDVIKCDEIILKKIQFGITQMMSPALLDEMSLITRDDIYTGGVIKYLSFYLFANKVHTEEREDVVRTYPATMWEELKRDFAPRWFKGRFPVRYSKDITHHTHKHYHVCPHLNYKDEAKHLKFMILNDVAGWENKKD